jgi:hypothetical protein
LAFYLASLSVSIEDVVDFRLVMPDGSIEYHEIKGSKRNGRFYTRDKGLIKIKVAATRYSDRRFYIVWKVKGEWRQELVPPEASG